MDFQLFWWGLTGIFSFVGALALYNTIRSCKKPMFGDDANAFIKTINILKAAGIKKQK